jgi:hypothetical protein
LPLFAITSPLDAREFALGAIVLRRQGLCPHARSGRLRSRRRAARGGL